MSMAACGSWMSVRLGAGSLEPGRHNLCFWREDEGDAAGIFACVVNTRLLVTMETSMYIREGGE